MVNSIRAIKFTFNLVGRYFSGESTFLGQFGQMSMRDWQPSFCRQVPKLWYVGM